MHIDVVNSEGTKFSVRARVHDINSIEVLYHDIPIAQRCGFVGGSVGLIRVVLNYSPIKSARPTVKSLSDLCFKVLTITFKRPFRKIKSLNAACILRDRIIDAGLTLNLEKNYGVMLLEYKLPFRLVAYDSSRIRLDRCVEGHLLTKKQLNSNYYIDYFCKTCLSDCFMYPKENKNI
nr:hypothetical protein TnSNPV_126 [Trichoplusia ni single nucleopolyhedrovirus]